MMKILFILYLSAFIAIMKLSANETTLIKRGEQVAKLLCQSNHLPKTKKDLNATIQAIIQSKACQNLEKKNLKALALFLMQKKDTLSLKVPKDAKCPVCGMFVAKYPKWAAIMQVGDKKFYFDGVKDMMKFYFYDQTFQFKRSKINKVLVQDFYTFKVVDARDAFYVVGSNVYGPMGKELIPFENLKEAKNFFKDHKGQKILRFNQITLDLIKSLDQ